MLFRSSSNRGSFARVFGGEYGKIGRELPFSNFLKIRNIYHPLQVHIHKSCRISVTGGRTDTIQGSSGRDFKESIINARFIPNRPKHTGKSLGIHTLRVVCSTAGTYRHVEYIDRTHFIKGRYCVSSFRSPCAYARSFASH